MVEHGKFGRLDAEWLGGLMQCNESESCCSVREGGLSLLSGLQCSQLRLACCRLQGKNCDVTSESLDLLKKSM